MKELTQSLSLGITVGKRYGRVCRFVPGKRGSLAGAIIAEKPVLGIRLSCYTTLGLKPLRVRHSVPYEIIHGGAVSAEAEADGPTGAVVPVQVTAQSIKRLPPRSVAKFGNTGCSLFMRDPGLPKR